MLKNIMMGCSKMSRCKAPANERPERTCGYVRIASLLATQQMGIFQQP